MKRRQVIAALAGAAVSPLTARAQDTPRIRRIGQLSPSLERDEQVKLYKATLDGALGDLGWGIGRNLEIDRRWGALDPALLARQGNVRIVYRWAEGSREHKEKPPTEAASAMPIVPIVGKSVLAGDREMAGLAYHVPPRVHDAVEQRVRDCGIEDLVCRATVDEIELGIGQDAGVFESIHCHLLEIFI